MQYCLNVFESIGAGLTCNLPSLGHLVQVFFAVLRETVQAGHRQVKRRRKLFVGPPGTCKLLGWVPACSVLLVKASREEGLAFVSCWNGLIISLAGFLSADSLFFFYTVLYLFRSTFLLLNFQASYCLYLGHHSFSFPLFLSQMALCTLSRLFLTTEIFFSKVWAKDMWLCHFRIRPCITDSWTPRSRYFGIKAPETRMSTEEDY